MLNLLNLGVTGAKRVTYRGDTVRALLLSIIERNPTADEDQINELFNEAVKFDSLEPVVQDALVYAVTNNYRLLTRKHDTTGAARQARYRGRRSAKMAALEAKIALATVLPSGKTVAASTFGELAMLGGMFTALSKAGKPDQIVGDVLTTNTALRKAAAA